MVQVSIQWDRPWHGDTGFLPSIILLVGNLLGLASLSALVTDRFHMIGINYRVYHVAATAARTGENLYTISPQGFSEFYTFLYPPIIIVPYIPLSYAPWQVGFLMQTVLTLLACIGGTIVLTRTLENRGHQLGWLDIGLVFWFLAFSVHSMPSQWYGNVNVLLGMGVLFGLYWLSTPGQQTGINAGMTFGGVALVKIFPTILGIYLLRVRQWRAIGAAIGIGTSGLLFGIGLFGWRTTREYLFEVLLPRRETGVFVGGYPPDGLYYVTIQRPLSHLLWSVWPTAPAIALLVSAIILLGVFLIICYRDVVTFQGQMVAMFGTCVVAIILFPAYRLYLVIAFFPMIILLYEISGSLQRVYATGMLLTAIPIRPGEIIEMAVSLPNPLLNIVSTIATLGTLQLWGLVIMMVVCCWLSVSSDPPTSSGSDIDG